MKKLWPWIRRELVDLQIAELRAELDSQTREYANKICDLEKKYRDRDWNQLAQQLRSARNQAQGHHLAVKGVLESTKAQLTEMQNAFLAEKVENIRLRGINKGMRRKLKMRAEERDTPVQFRVVPK